MGAIEDLEEAKVDVRKDKAGLFVSNNEAGKTVTPFNQKKVKVQSAAERSAFRSLDVPGKIQKNLAAKMINTVVEADDK